MLDYNTYKGQLNNIIVNNGTKNRIVDFVEETIKDYPLKKISILKASFATLKDIEPEIAFNLIKDSIDEIQDIKFLKVFQKRLQEYLALGFLTQNEQRILNKKIILNDIVESFLNELKIDTQKAFDTLDIKLEKYYYLKKTAITRILKRLDISSTSYKKLKEEYR